MAKPCKNEFLLIVPDKVETTEVKPGSDVTVGCHLSPEMSAADMEIRWFKGTDCVCLYMEGQMIPGKDYNGRVVLNKEMKRGNISLELKDVRESDDGDYLCQVTSEDRTKEKTIRLSLKNHECTEILQTEETTPEQTVLKEKMGKSALMAVFSEWKDTSKCLKKAKQKIKENEAENEELKAKLLQVGTPEKENRQLENMQENSKLKPDHPKTKTTPPEKQLLKIEKAKVFSLYSGNANALHKVHKTFIGTLQNQIANLREVGTVDDSDIVLNFCPIVSRAGTDIDSALIKFKANTGSKQAVLVVLHHTSDPEKTVPDSSRSVNRTDILTVDCLFYENTGLLKCQKNSDAYDKVVNWLIQQGEKTGVNIRPCGKTDKGISSWFSWGSGKKQVSADNLQQTSPAASCPVKYFVSVTGDAKEHHVHFIKALQKKINLKEVSTVEDSDVILLFCPDISGCHKGEDRPVVLIFLHQTLDPESPKRRVVFPVNYILRDGEGLIECQINNDEISAVSRWIKDKKQQASRKNTENPSSQVPPAFTSSHPVSYFTNLTGDAKKHLIHFIYEKLDQICLNEVSSVEDSDVILLFCPDISDCNKRTDKPVVLISLHNTPHSDSVPSSNEFVNRRDIVPLDCIYVEGQGLPDCKINQDEFSVFSKLLSTKIIK